MSNCTACGRPTRAEGRRRVSPRGGVLYSPTYGACTQSERQVRELRVAMSWRRLWQMQGKTEEAHEMLSGIYGWFSEGFDTPNLREARALLDPLA